MLRMLHDGQETRRADRLLVSGTCHTTLECGAPIAIHVWLYPHIGPGQTRVASLLRIARPDVIATAVSTCDMCRGVAGLNASSGGYVEKSEQNLEHPDAADLR